MFLRSAGGETGTALQRGLLRVETCRALLHAFQLSTPALRRVTHTIVNCINLVNTSLLRNLIKQFAPVYLYSSIHLK